LRAVVEDVPPETTSDTASKYPVAASRWWRTPDGGKDARGEGREGARSGSALCRRRLLPPPQNWEASVDPFRAVVEDVPPLTMSDTASK
jgi:hypothetical protein